MPEPRLLLAQIDLYAAQIDPIIGGQTPDTVAADVLRIRSLERVLEVIGEATRTLPEATRARMPEVPWPQVVGLRHMIVHEYFRLNVGVLFAIARDDIPVLRDAVRRVMAEDGIEPEQPPPRPAARP